MYILDILSLPLYGVRLIEASAGTGKTYSIIIIYIRLLLNLGNQSEFSRPLTVQEILIVTFTKSATQELIFRIRKNIHQFKLDCIRKYSTNDVFAKLLLQIQNFDLAIFQLEKAEKEIDQASIFTIHSFCQKILNQYAVELDILFDVSVMKDETMLYQQICTDFWRRHFYPLPLNIIQFIQENWKHPDILLQDVLPYLYINESYSHSKSITQKDIITLYNKIINYIINIKVKWINNKNEIITTIYNHNDINRKIYNKKNLKHWIKNINQWSEKITINHVFPIALERFRSSIIKIYNNDNQNLHVYSFFNNIEELYQQLSSLKTLIFNMAVNEICKSLHDTKHSRSQITFNELIDLLIYGLTKNKNGNLAELIRTRYPIAIIDEFQDTDFKQYKIFYILYFNYLKHGLILIGDPKQAIYSFRGANISEYIKIRRTISNRYNLHINWRSSSGMVNAINHLFQFTSNPFIFREILFTPSFTVNQNYIHRFLIDNKPQTSMRFWLYESNPILTIRDYREIMAMECVNIIHNLLHKIHQKKAWLENNKCKRMLQASDIVILVRNHKEAFFIQESLLKKNISTVFLSSKKNIFQTTESYELLLLLNAVISPNRETIFSALTTIFFKLNILDIETIYNNNSKFQKIFEQFLEYNSIWKNQGISVMIHKIIFTHTVSKKSLFTQIDEQNMINILHISELLQSVSQNLQYEHELIQWLISQMTHSKNNINNVPSDQLLRFNDNHQLIKISTIHKAKGLEFPLVFLPFIAADTFRCKHSSLSDFKILNKSSLKFNQCKSNNNDILLTNSEQLSEEVRLLYVAVTRSIYHCGIGIAPLVHKNYKQSIVNVNNSFYFSAVKYLIQKNSSGCAQSLIQNLKILEQYSNKDISFHYIKSQLVPSLSSIPTIKMELPLSARIWSQTIVKVIPWNITSYSELKCLNNNLLSSINFQAQKILNNDNNCNKYLYFNDIPLTPHNFPRGKLCGVFFHSLLEILDFQQPINIKELKIRIKKYNIDSHWIPIIQNWIHIIINTPLNNTNFTLSQIKSVNKKSEFKFYLPINTYITAQKLDDLCKRYDFLSDKSNPLNFSKVQGMLQGFIDLVFYWNGKYYLLDYKTNWLGNNNASYNYDNMQIAMITHHYALQYQLYTVALHRFLRHKIESYNYDKDFGGVYYLFVRGMDGSTTSNGIFFVRPLLTLINKLDSLLSG